MFLPITVKATENPSGTKTPFELHVQVRLNVNEILFIQFYSGDTSLVKLKTGTTYYVTETIEQIDVLLSGGNTATTKILFGKPKV